MAGFDLSVVIKAVDRATEPLRKVNERITKFTAPVRKLGGSLAALGEEAGFQRIGHAVHGVFESVKGVGEAFEGMIKKLLGMEIIGGLALYEIVVGAVEAGEALEKMAKRVGMGVDEFAGLQFAAKQADVNQESFTAGITYFAKALGQAKAGTGSLYTSLMRVDPIFALQVKRTKSVAEGLELMRGAISRQKDPMRQMYLAAAAFGKGTGADMLPFMTLASEEAAAYAKDFEHLAGSQEEFAKNAQPLNQAMNRTTAAFTALRNRAIAKLEPVLGRLFDKIAEFLAKNGDKLAAWAERAADAIGKWLDRGGFEELIAWLESAAKSVGAFIEKIGGIKGVLVIAAAIIAGPFLLAVGGLIASFAALAITLGASALVVGAVLGAFALLAVAAVAVYSQWDSFKLFWQFNVIDPINESIETLKEAWDWIQKTGAKVKDFFTTGMANVGSVVVGGQPVAAGGGAILPSGILGPAPTRQTNDAKVTIDIPNLPRGARVTTDPASTADVTLDLGYTNAGG